MPDAVRDLRQRDAEKKDGKEEIKQAVALVRPPRFRFKASKVQVVHLLSCP